ncbi:MAG: hypothetical protein ACREJ5_29875 [Geminicoccaceae bacterium]
MPSPARSRPRCWPACWMWRARRGTKSRRRDTADPTMAASDLTAWLRSLGLERYEATFRANDVDARRLRQGLNCARFDPLCRCCPQSPLLEEIVNLSVLWTPLHVWSRRPAT